MGRILATDVHVVGDRGPLDFIVLPAGSEVPAEYADQVTADSAYAVTADVDTEPETTDTGATGYAGQTVEQLREALHDRDLAKSGNKAELIARLTEDDEQRAAETGGDGQQGTDSEPDGSEPPQA